MQKSIKKTLVLGLVLSLIMSMFSFAFAQEDNAKQKSNSVST